MSDQAIVSWSGVPARSTFKLQCDGSRMTYDCSALVTVNDEPRPNIEHEEVNPGPARRQIEAAERWEVAPTLIVMNNLNNAITVKAWVEDRNGNVVQVPDGSGNTVPAQASWTSGRSAGSTLEVAIFIDSEAS